MKDLFVIKCGGSTLAELPDSFFADLRKLQEKGMMPVIVHGGGPAINEMLKKLQIESTFVNGLRQTDQAVLDVVEMVLAGQINKQVVRRIQMNGGKAVGLSGMDAELLLSEPVDNAGEVGFVGRVTKVNHSLIDGMIKMGYIPVIAPLGIDRHGQRYNINADTAAGAVASQLGTANMIVVTDVPGIIRTIDGEKKVAPTLTIKEIEQLIDSGEIYGGMIPKVKAAMDCMQGNVQQVVIVDGKEPEVLSRTLSGETIGTRLTKE